MSGELKRFRVHYAAQYIEYDTREVEAETSLDAKKMVIDTAYEVSPFPQVVEVSHVEELVLNEDSKTI